MAGLSASAIAEMVAAVDESELEYRKAMRDSTRAGPARSIAMPMASDGVDLADAQAVQKWIYAFNERPEDERIQLTEWSEG